MRGVCGRPGCEEPATVTFGFDGARGAVWLHPIDEPEGSGLLCSHHADTLVVPKGWTLHDERAGKPSSPRRRRRAAHDPAKRPAKPRTEPSAPAPTLPFPERSAGRTLRRPAWAEKADPDDSVGALLEADSPLLARAFRNAKPT
jgi:hypothetical protein